MNKLLCTTMLLAAALAAPAARSDSPDKAWYVGAGITKPGRLYLDGQVNNNRPNPCSVFAGYGLTDSFAIEAGYVASGSFKFSGPASIDINAVYVAAKGSIKPGAIAAADAPPFDGVPPGLYKVVTYRFDAWPGQGEIVASGRPLFIGTLYG